MASDVGPSAYARCFHNVARAAELLSWWRSTTPDYVEIAYTARGISRRKLNYGPRWPHEGSCVDARSIWGAKPIEVLPAAVTGTAQSIAGEVSRSAQPGPVPMPAGVFRRSMSPPTPWPSRWPRMSRTARRRWRRSPSKGFRRPRPPRPNFGAGLRAPPTSGRSLRLCSRCRRRGQWRRGRTEHPPGQQYRRG